ncbi:hypothetical protein P1X14_19025 [Sphingomonas sp. AOB5]|uniref:hypothetical protein n=1 Tax=Sphingomonas sp. AOB5 TaxID=3034017 RepID=UPI0023F662E5|nr:hypothetical protein [Sphingomonas sp. AOB5]MDF7777359.1 hypothetical protein [Sphingomonas sp. AOB5]
MDLVDRYLNAIRWNLYGAKADDIIAELRDLIASRIEDREEVLDRALTRDETSAVLREFGHPLVVASRYGTQQSLIGPEIFPFYLFSLKIVLAIGAAILIATGVFRAAFADRSMVQALAQGFDHIWWTLLSYAGLVTLIFAVLERTGWLSSHLRQWKPEQLPDLRDLRLKPKSIWESCFELAANAAFLLWWAGLIHIPAAARPGLDVQFSPVWMQLWWPIFALIAGRLLLNLIQLIRPRWREIQALLATATTFAALAVIATLYQAGRLVTLLSDTMIPVKLAKIQQSVDLALHVGLIAIAAIWTIQWATDLWKLWRMRRG